MSTWLIPNKSEDYDIRKGLAKYGNEIEWTKKLQTKNIATDDTIYIYMSAPVKALTMKFVVTDRHVVVPTQTHSNDGTVVGSQWFKISFLNDIEPIAYETLFNSGVVNGYIQSARKLNPEQERTLNEYIKTKNGSKHMLADDYKDILLSRGFVFIKSQKAYPGKLGEEHVFKHPLYATQFYVTRTGENQPYGFNPQRTIGEEFDKHHPHNSVGDKDYPFWTDGAFRALMDKLGDSIKLETIKKRLLDQGITTDEIAEEIGAADDLEDIKSILKLLATNLPPQRIERVVSKIVRDPKKAQLIKESKNYICEVCERTPFIQENGKPYAEADHIKPLGGDCGGLDTPENMRCLCAQCHAVITHGSSEAVGELLKDTKWQ